MKKFTFVLAILLAMGALAGCGGTGAGGPDKKANFEFETEKFKGKEITIWANWETTDTKGDIALFQSKTGATVKNEMIPYGTTSDGSEYFGKISNAILAGTGPDACYLWQFAVPTWAKSGLIQPWDDVIDITAEPFAGKLSKDVLDYYNFNGKHYGILNKNIMNFYWLYYDKSMFSNAGLEDPYELFRAGNWTWEKFLELGQKLTYDSDGDKIIDKYAFDGYATDGWIASNGANYVKWVDNKPVFAMTDANAVAAMEMEREVFMNIKPFSEIGEPGEKSFINGTIAMYYDGTWMIKTLKEAKGDNLGTVPMPTGPDFDTSKVTVNKINAVPMFITNNCKNEDKELLAHYVAYMHTDKGDEEEAKAETIAETFKGDKALYDFYMEMKDYGFIPNAISFGRLGRIMELKVLWNYNETPTKLVQSVVSLAQGEIDDVFYGTGE